MLPVDLTITPADLDDPELTAFLHEHLTDMEPTAPAESRHALDLEDLRAPDVRTWVAYCEGSLVGTVALAPVEAGHEELKSMRTAPSLRGVGIASTLLHHVLDDADGRGVRRVSLETGSMAFFAPARRLYTRHGFSPCPPFGRYVADPNSVFLTLELPLSPR